MAIQKCAWSMQLLHDLHQSADYLVRLYCDNQLTTHLVEKLIFHARTKNVEVHYNFIQEIML